MVVYLKNPEESTEKLLQTKRESRNFPSGPVVNAGDLHGVLRAPSAGSWGLIPGQGIRSHIMQLRAGCSQRKKNFFLRKFSYIVLYKINQKKSICTESLDDMESQNKNQIKKSLKPTKQKL